MGRAPLPHLIALACGLLAALAVGCGDRSNLIPASQASRLTAELAAIKDAVDAGRCDGLDTAVTRFHDDATGLNGSVDARLRKRINDGVASLQQHALPDCRKAAAAQRQTTDTVPTQTQTTATTTTQTQTETTTVPPTTTTTETPTAPSTVTPPSTSTPGTTTTPTTDNGGTAPEGQTP